ncbi:MAG: S8 family peptidase [Cryomorphaceae bacterium]|nr:S8 family peptidase [Cryomorphaceae bacterium]
MSGFKCIYIVLFLFVSGVLPAQTESTYWVYFQDKNATISDFSNPFQLFTRKAIERKANQQTIIDEMDLPVYQAYVDGLFAENVVGKSKWLNAALVRGIDSVYVANLPFVKRVDNLIPVKAVFAEDNGFSYGQSALQIEMLNGDYLHDLGFTGQGVLIAVFDGGFNNAQNIPAFSHLWQGGGVKGMYSFVNQDTNIFFPGSHGTHVLSVLAAKNEGTFVGTAPDADYWLFMTEDEVREVNAEEFNWLAAAEMSDSLGVDVINSSLGYSTFDPGQTSYSLSDLDGQTSIVSQAAQFAARKGILVINSAGNSGSDPLWRKILMPADADSILAVGSVGPTLDRSIFSSKGPTVDGRIKPDVVAMGEQARYLSSGGFPTVGNGTSFAAPLIAGLAACLRQAYPNHSTENIRQTILQSADRYLTPDTLYGYGLPNFQFAFNDVVSVEEFIQDYGVNIFPNPVDNILTVSWNEQFIPKRIALFDMGGRKILDQAVSAQDMQQAIDVNNLTDGKYIIHIYNESGAIVKTFNKHGN